MTGRLKTFVFTLAAGFVLIGGVGIWYFRSHPSQDVPALPQPQAYTTTSRLVLGVATSTKNPVKTSPTSTKGAASSTTTALPEAWRLDIPFLSQAPTKNWELPYQEACEEASVLMVQAYYKGETKNFSPAAGDAAILDLIEWEAEKYGPEYVDSSIQEVADIITAYMPELQTKVIPVTTETALKKILVQGYPIVIPADGKALKNPHFHNGGPVYHVLVLTGYLADGRWITNDPGTQFGDDYVYGKDLFFNAIHDWNKGDTPRGARSVLVVLPKGASLRMD